MSTNLKDIDEKNSYYELAAVLNDAFIQASCGKGNIRHAYGNEQYEDQLICEMDRRLNGSAVGPRYQAVKKIYESARMEPDKAIHELLGAINYIAAAIILLKEQRQVTYPLRVEEEYPKTAAGNDTVKVVSSWSPQDNNPQGEIFTAKQKIILSEGNK